MEVSEIAETARKYAVMVRIRGPDPKGLKMRRHPFHHYQDGMTTLSASGILLPDSTSRSLGILGKIGGDYSAVVVTTSSLVEPFLRVQPNSPEHLGAKVVFPEMINETCIDVLVDQEDKECSFNEQNADPRWIKAQLLAVVDVPTSTLALQSLIGSHSTSHENSSWDVGWSLAPLKNNHFHDTDGLNNEALSDSAGRYPQSPIAATIAILGIMQVDIKELPRIDISQTQKKGDQLLVMGSPFGILSPLHFFNSISVGTVANCCPADSSKSSLVMADIRCLPGTEGAPVFDMHAHLIGLLTRPLRQKGLATEIQLVISWNAITSACNVVPSDLQYKAEKLHECEKFDRPLKTQTPVEKAIASVVLITVGNGSWASGVLLNTRGLILTNAHLLEPWRYGRPSLYSVANEMEDLPVRPAISDEIFHEPALQSIVLQEKKQNHLPSSSWSSHDKKTVNSSYRNYQKLRVRLNHSKPWVWVNARVVYISKGPMDVALVQLEYVPDEVLPMILDFTPPTPGLPVHVIGHGPFGPRSDVYPHVSTGVVSRVIRIPSSQENMLENQESLLIMIETTAAVYPGMSGGAVVNSNGHMIGLVTSNAKHGGGAIIPELNFSIPQAALKDVIRFSEVEQDLSILEVLDKQNTLLSSVWALKSPPSSKPQSILEKIEKGGKGSRFSEFLTKRKIENSLFVDQELERKSTTKPHSKL